MVQQTPYTPNQEKLICGGKKGAKKKIKQKETNGSDFNLIKDHNTTTVGKGKENEISSNPSGDPMHNETEPPRRGHQFLSICLALNTLLKQDVTLLPEKNETHDKDMSWGPITQKEDDPFA